MELELNEIIIPTGVARKGMTVGEVFEECVAHDVPGIPFCDEQDEVIGRVSIRHTLMQTCIPDYVVKGAHLLSDTITAVRIPNKLAREVLDLDAEQFILEDVTIIGPASPIIKAVAMMESHNSSYAFVVDDDGKYQGTITRMGIAALMLKVRDS